jgi:hypothetical protein
MNWPISWTATARTRGSRLELSSATSCLRKCGRVSAPASAVFAKFDQRCLLDNLPVLLKPDLFHIFLPKLLRLVCR